MGHYFLDTQYLVHKSIPPYLPRGMYRYTGSKIASELRGKERDYRELKHVVRDTVFTFQ